MTWTQMKMWACRLAALGMVVGGGVIASRDLQAQSPPVEPRVKQGAFPLKGSRPVPPDDSRDSEAEALKKQIEVLRKKIKVLEKEQKFPDREHHKIVVTSPQVKDVVITHQYVCQMRSHHHINICALANGIITEVPVKEGQAVKRGEVIFKVSPTVHQAKLDAELAEVKLAELEFNNAKKLFDQKVISDTEVALCTAKLAKVRAKAKLAEAELGFTTVKAPFDGIVDHFELQEGSLVKEGDIFTTLSDYSVMWAYYNVPEARYLEYMADREQMLKGSPVELELSNGSKFPQPGKHAAVEASFNDATGNISFRADFPNPDRLLRHGQTGNVLVSRTLKNASVIPQRATFEIRDKRYVYVIDKDNVAHQREIIVQNELDNDFVIKKGLAVNERVVLEGVRQVHDGEKVEYEFRKPEEGDTNPNPR